MSFAHAFTVPRKKKREKKIRRFADREGFFGDVVIKKAFLTGFWVLCGGILHQIFLMNKFKAKLSSPAKKHEIAQNFVLFHV